MNKTPSNSNPIVDTADLSKSKVTQFLITADADRETQMSHELGVSAVTKLRFEGKIKPHGKRDFLLLGHLGVTVEQPCGVTLDPVRTRIDESVERLFVAGLEESFSDEETEIPDDDRIEPLEATIDLWAIAREHIALVIPAFPRRADLDEFEISATPEGAAPLDEDAMKPFAGLAALKAQLEGKKN